MTKITPSNELHSIDKLWMRFNCTLSVPLFGSYHNFAPILEINTEAFYYLFVTSSTVLNKIYAEQHYIRHFNNPAIFLIANKF